MSPPEKYHRQNIQYVFLSLSLGRRGGGRRGAGGGRGAFKLANQLGKTVTVKVKTLREKQHTKVLRTGGGEVRHKVRKRIKEILNDRKHKKIKKWPLAASANDELDELQPGTRERPRE